MASAEVKARNCDLDFDRHLTFAPKGYGSSTVSLYATSFNQDIHSNGPFSNIFGTMADDSSSHPRSRQPSGSTVGQPTFEFSEDPFVHGSSYHAHQQHGHSPSPLEGGSGSHSSYQRILPATHQSSSSMQYPTMMETDTADPSDISGIPSLRPSASPVSFQESDDAGRRSQFRRRRDSSAVEFASPSFLTDEQKLLLELRDEQNMPWKDIAARFQRDLGRTDRVPALQMRYKRLKERLRVWTDTDVEALRRAHEYWETRKFEIISEKMLEFGCGEKWPPRHCAAKWRELNPGPDPVYYGPGFVATPQQEHGHGLGQAQVQLDYGQYSYQQQTPTQSYQFPSSSPSGSQPTTYSPSGAPGQGFGMQSYSSSPSHLHPYRSVTFPPVSMAQSGSPSQSRSNPGQGF